MSKLACRPGCAACCIAPSISSLGKAAMVPCRELTEEGLCAMYGKPERPSVCLSLQASREICGYTREAAIAYLAALEAATAPGT